MEPAVILRYMADLAGATASSNTGLPGGPPPETVDLTRTREPAEWLGTSVALPLAPPGIAVEGQAGPPSIRFTPTVAHLSMLDALQPADHLLRLGWVVVAGRVIVEGRTLTCCFPLVSQPVRLTDPGFMRGTALLPAGAAELTPLVGDPSTAATLEAAAEYGGGALDPTHSQEAAGAGLIGRLPRLRSWIAAVVEACGLPPVTAVLPPSDDPLTHRTDDDLVAVVGAVLYAARDVFRPSAEGALRSWAAQEGTGATAFASLYSPDQPASDAAAGRDADGDPELGDHDDRPLFTPLRLSAAQADAVRRARRQPVSVISGPPGSGKSQAVAAIAADSVAHGGSVLVATRSEHAADVVTALLAREPGPDPVRFGGAHNDDIVRQATAPGASGRDVEAAHRALDEARARRRLAERAVTTLLDREEAAGRATSWDGVVGELTALAPGAFAPTGDLAALAALAARSDPPAGASWWRRWRARRAERALRRALGAAPTTPLAELRTALRCAGDRRAAAELAVAGGTSTGAATAVLVDADDALRAAAGRVAAVEGAREDRRRRGRGAAGELATALRAGRRQRRRLLRRLDGEGVVQGLPLWVGTLRDVDDLVPETPGLFDLLVLDEASQIDQISAAGALLRARRAVVVGDPRQLRHVSFVGDDLIARTLAAHGLDMLAARLDVRRASVLDVAAGAAPTNWLDEHYRSVPHLIEFSARRFYEGRLHIATRHPANEATDVIEVVRDGAELDAALARVDRLARAGLTDIALVSPFRDVADAAQAALLDGYELADVQRLGLRVGTVHGFQGAEADHVVLVLGIGGDDPAGRRRFVEDPHLFNVMVTRARRSLAVVTSLPPEDRASSSGLIEDYLAHAERPPQPPADGTPPSAWAAALARELARAGVRVRTGYPVGRWTVDLCVGEGEAAVAVDTGVHPAGAAAHLARHRMLAAAGWRQIDAYPTRWDHDAPRAAVELAAYR